MENKTTDRGNETEDKGNTWQSRQEIIKGLSMLVLFYSETLPCLTKQFCFLPRLILLLLFFHPLFFLFLHILLFPVIRHYFFMAVIFITIITIATTTISVTSKDIINNCNSIIISHFPCAENYNLTPERKNNNDKITITVY